MFSNDTWAKIGMWVIGGLCALALLIFSFMAKTIMKFIGIKWNDFVARQNKSEANQEAMVKELKGVNEKLSQLNTNYARMEERIEATNEKLDTHQKRLDSHERILLKLTNTSDD